MRTIKFRAWDTKYKEWVTEDQMPILSDTNNKIFEFGDTDHVRFMQYTGLKDKNGKEIYEGDIIILFNSDDQIQNKEITCVVGMSPFGAWQATVNIVHLWEHYNIEPPEKGTPLYFLNLSTNGNYEKIGNIHENPELL